MMTTSQKPRLPLVLNVVISLNQFTFVIKQNDKNLKIISQKNEVLQMNMLDVTEEEACVFVWKTVKDYEVLVMRPGSEYEKVQIEARWGFERTWNEIVEKPLDK